MLEDVYDKINQNPSLALSVLIVEDQTESALIMGKILSSFKCDVTHAQDGLEAIELAKKSHFDLMVIDWVMPLVNGKKTLKMFDEFLASGFLEHHSDKLPFVICSGARPNQIRIPQLHHMQLFDVWEKNDGWLYLRGRIHKLINEWKRGIA